MKRIRKLKKEFKNWNPSIYATIILFLIPFFCFSCGEYTFDNDFYFLINTGKYILKHGFIWVEPFTIHEGLFFVPQQWLSSVVFYVVYDKLGSVGTFIFIIITNAFILYLFYHLSLLVSKKRITAIVVSIVLDIILILSGLITTRPQLFDIVIFLLELLILEKYFKEKNKKSLYFLPLLSVLLINMHAALWLMLFVIMIPYYVEYAFKRLKKERTLPLNPLVLVTVLSLLGGLLNPYHIYAIEYFFKSFGVPEINNYVGEMKNLCIDHNFVIFVFIFVEMLFIYKNKGKNKIRYICLFLGTCYLTLSHLRGLLFLALSFLLVVSDALCEVRMKKKPNKLNDREKIIYKVTIVIFIVALCLSINVNDRSVLNPIADYLDKNTTHKAKLYTNYDEGGYFEYRGYKCYIDPRAEVFLKTNNKKSDIFSEYIKLISGETKASKFLCKYNFDYLVITNKDYFLKNELDLNEAYQRVLRVEGLKSRTKKIYYLYRRTNGKSC